MLKELDTAPAVIRSAETSMLYDVATLINAVYQMNIEPIKSGLLPKRLTKKLIPLLKGQKRLDYEEEEAYIDMLMHILKTLKIITFMQPAIEKAKPYLAPGSALQAWTRMNSLEQTKWLVEQWQQNPNWLDSNLLMPNGSSWGYYYGANIIRTRHMLSSYLANCQVNLWYSMELAVKEIWQANPNLASQYMLPRYNQQGQLLTKKGDPFEFWAAENTALIANMFFSSLQELGLVDVGHEAIALEESSLRFSSCAFRLTELGKQILTAKDTKKEKNFVLIGQESVEIPKKSEPKKLLIVQPNYEILLLQPDMQTLYSILPFTQVKQINLVSTVTLTQAALHRALQSGYHLNDILQLLTKQSQKELPQNVTYTLEDWTKQYKEATISHVALLELPNEESATRLCKHATFIKLGARQISPSIIVFPLDPSGNINHQTIRTVLEKENITSHFHIPAKPLNEHYNEIYY